MDVTIILFSLSVLSHTKITGLICRPLRGNRVEDETTGAFMFVGYIYIRESKEGQLARYSYNLVEAEVHNYQRYAFEDRNWNLLHQLNCIIIRE